MNIKINILLLYVIIQWFSVYTIFCYLESRSSETWSSCRYYRWNAANSNVLCRERGYRDALSYINTPYNRYLTSSSKYEYCVGNEYNLTQCPFTLSSFCGYDITITCRIEGCQSYISEIHTSSEAVRYYEDEQWFFLCSTYLTMNEADVICRENGYRNGAESIGSIPKSVLYGDYPTYQYNISCDGDESSLCDCNRTEIVCSDDVATVKCFPPESGILRFSLYQPNTLEIYLNAVWYIIKYTNLDERISLIACKELGYPKAYYYTNTIYRGSYVLAKFYPNYTSIDCVGNEEYLTDCNFTFSPLIIVGLTYIPSFIVQYCTRGDCEVHAPSITDIYQIVEYFVDGLRYFICADYFTPENADVVCREMSLTSSISFRNVSFEEVSPYTSIYPLRHNCFGNESSLCNCSVSNQICLTSSVVEVQCGEPDRGTIRVSSIGDYLEVFLNGWKYVCGDVFSSSNADVACRRLGFKTYEKWRISSNHFKQNVHLLRNLRCKGDEASILNCPFTSKSSCNQNLILYCESGNCESFVSNGDVKPVPVRFYDGQANYYLCATGFTSETANVICREGDYGRVKSISNVSQSSELNYLISANAYSCVGDEKSLCDCFSSPIVCEDEMIAVVQCKKPDFGQSRIRREELQIYHGDVWTNVCFGTWNNANCDVTCRQFGYGTRSQGCILSAQNLWFEKWIGDISCHGNETRLVECNYEIKFYCLVDDQNSLSLDCESGGCRSYVADASPHIVRYYELAWYQLIADNFTFADATVVCKENFGTKAVNFAPIQSTNPTTGTTLPPILQRTFGCVGNESSLCDCPSSVYSGLSDTVVEVECIKPVFPFITTPSENITIDLLYTDAIDEMYECSAGGTPTPEVYWTTDFIGRVGSSSTLHLIVSKEPTLYDSNYVYYCVAESMAGRAIISVTFDVMLPDVNNVQKELDRIEMELLRTESISQTTAVTTITNIQAYLDALNETSKTYEFGQLLTTATEIIGRIVQSTEGRFSEETTLLIANLFATIVHLTEGLYTYSLGKNVISTIPDAFSTAIYTLEEFSDRLCEELLADDERSVNTIETDYISIIVQVIELEDIVNRGESDISLPITTGVDYPISILIPLKVALILSSDGERLAIASLIIKRNQDIKIHESESEMFVQASDILTTSIAGRNSVAAGRFGEIYLTDEVTVAFETSSDSGFSAICAHLYETEWFIGNLITIEESYGLTTCESKYFTRLAVFVTRYDYVFPRTFFSVMSYIIVSISVICLIISLILFCIAGKAFFKVEANYIYFNYCIALLLATSSFLFVIEYGTFVTTFCQIIAFTLQMTWLAVFTWTVCIGIFILFKLRLIVTSIPKFYSCLTIFGWGFTVLIPIITASVSRIGYVNATEHCYMEHKYEQVFSFIAPIILLLGIHILLLIIAIIKIIINKWKDRITPHQATIKHMFISTLILTPALGLPIVFLMLHSFYNYESLLFVFIISTGLIGLIFLLVVVLRVKEVQAIFKKKPEPEVVEVNNLPEPEVVEVNNLDGQAPPLYEDVIEISHTNDAYINPMYGMNWLRLENELDGSCS